MPPAAELRPRAVPRALNVTLVLQCERWRFVRVGLAVPLLGTVADLREMVAREGRIPPEQVTGARRAGNAGGARGVLRGRRCPAGDPGRGVPAGLPALAVRPRGAGGGR